MRQVKLWTAAVVVGLAAASVADVLLDVLGYAPNLGGGLAAGAGVTAGALTARWLEQRHKARERLAQFHAPDRV